MIKPKRYKKGKPDYLRDYMLDFSEQWKTSDGPTKTKSTKKLTHKQSAVMLAACIDTITLLAQNKTTTISIPAGKLIESMLEVMAKGLGQTLKEDNIQPIYSMFLQTLLNATFAKPKDETQVESVKT